MRSTLAVECLNKLSRLKLDDYIRGMDAPAPSGIHTANQEDPCTGVLEAQDEKQNAKFLFLKQFAEPALS